MMTKFLNLLAQAEVVTLAPSGHAVDVTVAPIAHRPENEVACLTWTEEGVGACSAKLTEAGLAEASFDATTQTFTVEDYEGDLVELKLVSNGIVLTPESEDMVYVVVQEGGSSSELYVHAYPSYQAASEFRMACHEEGSYRTSKDIIEVPASLADHPMFFEFAEMLARATTRLGYPARNREGE